jgi:hypothetical protein
MQTKNLVGYNYNVNMGTKIIRRINSIKRTQLLTRLFLLLLLIICFTIITHFYKALTNVNNRNISVSDFRLDINMISETAATIDVERTSNKDSQLNSFGSDGKLMKTDEITPDLTAALINIADSNKDGKISNVDMSTLGIMRLKPDIFQKKLGELQFKLKSADCNLKNYIIITQGKYAGTILYNGPLKFIDGENNRYVGLELFN